MQYAWQLALVLVPVYFIKHSCSISITCMPLIMVSLIVFPLSSAKYNLNEKYGTVLSKVAHLKRASSSLCLSVSISVIHVTDFFCLDYIIIAIIRFNKNHHYPYMLCISVGVVSDVTTRHVVSSHEITCCGVDFSPSGRSLASGDLAGNVWVTEGTEVKTAFKCNVIKSLKEIGTFFDLNSNNSHTMFRTIS